MLPENYTSPLTIKTTSTTLKWVSKVDFIFGNEEFYFSTIIPLRSNSGLECDPKLRKCGRNIELHVSARKSRPRLQLSNGYPKLISYLETKNFTFQPIIPLCSNSGLECDPKLRKCDRRTTRLPRNQDHVYNSQMGIQS
jgi:hypothetical protein